MQLKEVFLRSAFRHGAASEMELGGGGLEQTFWYEDDFYAAPTDLWWPNTDGLRATRTGRVVTLTANIGRTPDDGAIQQWETLNWGHPLPAEFRPAADGDVYFDQVVLLDVRRDTDPTQQWVVGAVEIYKDGVLYFLSPNFSPGLTDIPADATEIRTSFSFSYLAAE